MCSPASRDAAGHRFRVAHHARQRPAAACRSAGGAPGFGPKSWFVRLRNPARAARTTSSSPSPSRSIRSGTSALSSFVALARRGFYDGLREFLQHTIRERMMGDAHAAMWQFVDAVEDVLPAIHGSEA